MSVLKYDIKWSFRKSTHLFPISVHSEFQTGETAVSMNVLLSRNESSPHSLLNVVSIRSIRKRIVARWWSGFTSVRSDRNSSDGS